MGVIKGVFRQEVVLLFFFSGFFRSLKILKFRDLDIWVFRAGGM